MSTLKLMTAAMIASALMLGMTTRANAQTVNNNVKVNCTTGAYGQSSTCTAEAAGSATGSAGQQIIYRNGSVAGYTHKTVDAGMDLGTAVMALGTALSGGVATVIKLKNRVA